MSADQDTSFETPPTPGNGGHRRMLRRVAIAVTCLVVTAGLCLAAYAALIAAAWSAGDA
jgi:hypothetical protein